MPFSFSDSNIVLLCFTDGPPLRAKRKRIRVIVSFKFMYHFRKTFTSYIFQKIIIYYICNFPREAFVLCIDDRRQNNYTGKFSEPKMQKGTNEGADLIYAGFDIIITPNGTSHRSMHKPIIAALNRG